MAAKTNSETPMYKRLYRSERYRMLGGVCGGIAEYFNVDPTLIRLAFVAITLVGGASVLVYLVLWLIIPTESQVDGKSDYIHENAEEMKETAKKIAGEFKHNTNGKNTH